MVLDAGALIGVERGLRSLSVRLDEVRTAGGLLVVPCSVFAQVWRGGGRQARLARLRGAEDVVTAVLDDEASYAVGALLAVSGTSDVVDAHVVHVARQVKATAVLTSDPDDLRRLDPRLRLVAV